MTAETQVPTPAPRREELAAARAFYLAMYERDGGKWEAVDPRCHPVWVEKAKRVLTAARTQAEGRADGVATHDMHGGYGRCSGLGKVWVDDGEQSNFYEGGSCPECRPSSALMSADGVGEAADLTSPYVPVAIHYEEADYLEFVIRDVPTACRHIQSNLDALITHDTREPIGWRIYGWSRIRPAHPSPATPASPDVEEIQAWALIIDPYAFMRSQWTGAFIKASHTREAALAKARQIAERIGAASGVK